MHPPPVNLSPTSLQPRAIKLGTQAQLILLIKARQEKNIDPLPYFTLLTLLFPTQP